LVDPELACGLAPGTTAATGLDALTQLIEPLVCNRANPLSDALCRDGIARVARALPVAMREPLNVGARAELALGAFYSGIALTNAGLGAVHGLAAPLGGWFHAPHGAVCAALLPHVLRVNLRALRERLPASPVLARFDEVSRLLTGNAAARADDGPAWCAALNRELGIPPLETWGVREVDLAPLAEKALVASSMKANPLPLTTADLIEVLAGALAA
jgi:alcohol dehydrogenase class IV